jgi:DNA (cytosine-5)-methyltransferase 3A
MRVLSLFDGISCARVALDRAGIKVETYYASEIEKNAMKVSGKNWPEIVQIGDVSNLFLDGAKGFKIDLLIGGSPCQDLSIAKKDRKGLEGNRSGLFWEYVRLLRELKPKWFILENVASMPKADKDIITREMGVEPVMFNASLVSAQCRKRLFWTNIPFELPEDKGILLKDILQPDGEVDERMVMKGKSYCLTATYSHANTTEAGVKNSVERKQRTMVKVGHIGTSDAQGNRVYSTEGKTPTLSANGGGLGAKTGLYAHNDKIRKLTPIECERLQGLPDNYTEGVATTNRYKCLGNAFNVDVVCHILTGIKSPT